MNRRVVLLLTAPLTLLMLAAPSGPAAAAGAHFDLSRPDIRAYIDRLAARGLPRAEVVSVLAHAVPQPEIIDSMNRPVEKTLQWWQYRAIFMTPQRIADGAALWREHRELLAQIAAQYQVPPQYLIAVLGVESKYGRISGPYRVIDALSTLAFDYPPRARFFRRELTDFLLLARKDKLDPLQVRGSYAGAMGALQFMPSSYLSYAVDEDHSGSVNLWQDWADIFASVANYLHRSGWRDGQPALADAQLSAGRTLDPPQTLDFDQTVGGLRALGLSFDTTLPDDAHAALIGATLQHGMSYRVAFHNFHVITRYNDSPLYAMVVCDLARAVKAEFARTAGP